MGRTAEAPPAAEAAILLCKGHQLHPASKQEKLLIAAPSSHLLLSIADWLLVPRWGSSFLSQCLPRWHGLLLKDSPGTSLSLQVGTSWNEWHQALPGHCSTECPGFHLAHSSLTWCHMCLLHLRLPSPAVLPEGSPVFPQCDGVHWGWTRAPWAWSCSRCAVWVYVTTACTWPVTPTAACLEHHNITGNELHSWAETLTMNYWLLPLVHLFPSHFFSISRWWEWNCVRQNKQKACTRCHQVLLLPCELLSAAELAQLSLTGATTARQSQSPTAVIVPGAQPASCSPSATRCGSGPSHCHRGERLKGTKPSRLSVSKGMVQAQPSQLPERALGLVELHPKAVDSGSPSIKVLTGTNLHQSPAWPVASTHYLHTESHVQPCQACLESGIRGSGPKNSQLWTVNPSNPVPQSLWLMGTNTPFLSTKEMSNLKSRTQRQPGNWAHTDVAHTRGSWEKLGQDVQSALVVS